MVAFRERFPLRRLKDGAFDDERRTMMEMNYDLPFSISLTFAATLMRDEKSVGEHRAGIKAGASPNARSRFPPLLRRVKKKGKKMATPRNVMVTLQITRCVF